MSCASVDFPDAEYPIIEIFKVFSLFYNDHLLLLYIIMSGLSRLFVDEKIYKMYNTHIHTMSIE